MASLLILAGTMIHDRVKERKDAKRKKTLEMERNYRLLQAETARRTNKGVERNYDSEDEKEDEPLPRYEDIVDNGEGSSSNTGSGNNSQVTPTGEAPPGYRRREPRRRPGVEFPPEIL